MDVIVRFTVDHLNHIEKPSFFRALNDRITEDELFCNRAIRIPEVKLDDVRHAFDRWDVPTTTYRVEEVETHDRP
ncbi:MAG: hypothetical protein SVU32_01600 [Candidatus Nanohaloarchaea archaeon]|nr:hypothetical protein [Candidatus Nanohaloarchaea archaeon]